MTSSTATPREELPARLARTQSVAVVALLFAVNGPPLLLVGWALVGLGVGMIAPQAYAVAGHLGGGRVLAVVVTFGYAAFLAGPALIGFLVNQLGIHRTIAVPALLCAGIIGLAATMPKNDDDLTGAP